VKRWALRILLFLLGGAIVNVAVAWAIAFWLDVNGRGGPDSSYETLQAQIFRCAGATHVEVQVKRASSANLAKAADSLADTLGVWLPTISDSHAVIVDLRGWPFLSLATWHVPPTFERFTTESASRMRWGIRTGRRWSHAYLVPRALPLRPLWPGFAINTVFYAFILWLLFALGGTPFVLRRRRRIRRGLCPTCAYDLRGATGEVCAECGAAVTPRSRSLST